MVLLFNVVVIGLISVYDELPPAAAASKPTRPPLSSKPRPKTLSTAILRATTPYTTTLSTADSHTTTPDTTIMSTADPGTTTLSTADSHTTTPDTTSMSTADPSTTIPDTTTLTEDKNCTIGNRDDGWFVNERWTKGDVMSADMALEAGANRTLVELKRKDRRVPMLVCNLECVQTEECVYAKLESRNGGVGKCVLCMVKVVLTTAATEKLDVASGLYLGSAGDHRTRIKDKTQQNMT